MKKIYTITFHWATNYGAVLQAYALNSYLRMSGYEAYVIDYVPDKLEKHVWSIFHARTIKKIFTQIKEYIKEIKIKRFRQKYICLTQRFHNNHELKSFYWDDDIFICGSDQIWNSYFTMNGEGQITTSYFLDFPPQKAIRMAYAASFGALDIEKNVQAVIYPLLENFNKITVRENTAVSIINKMTLGASLVCDPVFLLEVKTYAGLFKEKSVKEKYVFSYALHHLKNDTKLVSEYIVKKYNLSKVNRRECLSVEDWLGVIYNSEYVVTNSFHAVAFSIIFHKPFIALLIPESGMNDRIFTILKLVGLEHCILEEYNISKVDNILKKNIAWDKVDAKMNVIKEQSKEILKSILSEVLDNDR